MMNEWLYYKKIEIGGFVRFMGGPWALLGFAALAGACGFFLSLAFMLAT